jgi:hypothetical protein
MKIPPFGKPLYDLIQSDQRPQNSVYLFIGKDAWKDGKSSSLTRPTRTLALPPFHPPTFYDWPVNECDILIFDSGGCEEEYIEEIVFTLLKSQAEIVRCITPDFSHYGTFKRDFEHVK